MADHPGDGPLRSVYINNRWELLLPDHKASLPCWQHWEYQRLTAMKAAIRPGDTVYDIGAEQGDLSALFSKWSGGSVVLVEPAAEAWPTIRTIFEANNLQPPLASYVGFLSETNDDGAVKFGWPDESQGELIPEPGFRCVAERDDIPSTSLDTLVALTNMPPDVITIDVEGAELLVLKGAEKSLAQYRPTVFVSVHPEMMRETFGQTPDDLHVLMTAHYDYDVTYLGFDHEYHFLYNPTP